MSPWTPAERRGALLVAILFALGAGRDLWRARHPRWAPPPADRVEAVGPALPAGRGPSARAGAAPAALERVDLNRAGLDELDALPGIGPVLAGRILQHRARYGPFLEPADLLAIRGIGPRLFERLRSRVCVSAGPDSARRGVEGHRAAARTGPPVPP